MKLWDSQSLWVSNSVSSTALIECSQTEWTLEILNLVQLGVQLRKDNFVSKSKAASKKCVIPHNSIVYRGNFVWVSLPCTQTTLFQRQCNVHNVGTTINAKTMLYAYWVNLHVLVCVEYHHWCVWTFLSLLDVV